MGTHIPSDSPYTITIPSGGTTSGEIGNFDDCECLGITGPAALTGTVVTVQVNPSPTGGNWATLRSGTADVTMSAALQHVVISEIGFRRLRVLSNAAEAAARDFLVTKQVRV